MILPDSLLTRIEKSALERFKNENTLLKEFGPEAIKVYRAITEKISVSDLLSNINLSEDEVLPILEFMEQNGLLLVENKETEDENHDNSTDTDYEESNLTEAEKKIKATFGEKGLRIYSLIDGIRTANEIMEEANVSEAELMEVLTFLEREGIITLDQQDQRNDGQEFKQETATAEIEKFKDELKKKANPLEEIEIKDDEIIDTEGDIIPIDLPFKATKPSIQAYSEMTKLMLKHGKKIMDLYNSIDGFKDVIGLALEHNMTLPQINMMLAELGKRDMVLFRQLTRKEIKSRYSEDGYAVYKVYGVEGVFLYELVGRIDDLKKMVELSGIEAKKVVDIFIFIHKILGIDIPISKKLLYKQLGIE